jgi:MFS family permease
VLADLPLSPQAIGPVTSAVQLGFIAGTLVFAFLAVSDVFSPRKVFFLCSLAGAAANAAVYVLGAELPFLLGSRFVTGFFLAGIYPVSAMRSASWSAHWRSARPFPIS